MHFNIEFIFTLVIQCIATGVMIGIFKTSLSFMQEQIKDLKEEMHRYNSVLARLAVAENSIKSCHNRIDTLEERL